MAERPLANGSRTRPRPSLCEHPYPVLVGDNGTGYYSGCLTAGPKQPNRRYRMSEATGPRVRALSKNKAIFSSLGGIGPRCQGIVVTRFQPVI